MAAKKKATKRKGVTRKSQRQAAARRRKWLLVGLLMLALIALAPLAEREVLIVAHSNEQITEGARGVAYKFAQSVSSASSPLSFWWYRLSGDWGKDLLLSGRYAAAVGAYELARTQRLLKDDDYPGAREFVIASISGKDSAELLAAVRAYEVENFAELKDDYLRVNFDWSYDAFRLAIPQYIRPYIDRNFFSTFIDYQELSLRRYQPATYDGVFLALKVSNDFLALSPIGSISFEAKGKSDIKGTIKSIARTAMSGVSGLIDKGIDVAVDVWNGSEPPKVQRLQAQPQTSIWHIGKAFKPAKGFEIDPAILEQEWRAE